MFYIKQIKGGGDKMNPTKLMINGKNRFVEKDKFGKPVRYTKCKNLKDNKCFLNIWSPKQYLFGQYDIWFSKNGDELVLEFQEGNMTFVFENKRFWLTRDTVLERKAKETFKAEYPNVVNVTLKGDNLVATFEAEEINYKYTEGKDGIRFKEYLKKGLEGIKQDEKVPEEAKGEEEIPTPNNQESALQENPDTNSVQCSRDCYFQVGGTCKYFDWELLEATGETPDCGEPFLYFETLA